MKFLREIWTDDSEAVIPYKGKNYSVKVEIVYDDYGIPNKCLIHEFAPTLLPLSQEPKAGNKWSYYAKWGGSPNFIQNEAYPTTDDDIPYDFLCTIYNGWGDNGNCNIFILTELGKDGKTYIIKDIYMEYSCH